jgi:hypothetical protein
MPITFVQDPATGTFESTSGSATLNATEAGSQIILITGIIGNLSIGTRIARPSGFADLGYSDIGFSDRYASVQAFMKPAASAGETSWTLALETGTRRVVWVALEVTGVDLSWLNSVYLVGDGVLEGFVSTASTSTVTCPLSETYDGLSLAVCMATDTGGTTPTISGHTGGFEVIASQTGTDASSRAARLSVATKTEQAVNTPTCTATVSPASYLADYLVTLTSVDAHHAPTITAMSGFEIGTATSITNKGLGTGAGTKAPFDGVTGTPAIVATSPRSGGFCLELSSSAAAENLTWTHTAGTNLDDFGIHDWVERFHVYFPTSLPSGNVDLFSAEVNGSLSNGMIIRYVSASQKIGVKIGTGTEVLSDATVAANTWIGIDFWYDTSGDTSHTCQWQVDYNAATSDPTPSVPQAAVGSAGVVGGFVDTVRHGWTTSTTATVRYDDIVGSKVRKTYPLGDTRIVPLKVDPAGTPTVSGTSGNFRTFTSNGTLAAWTAAATITTLDEIPPVVGASSDGLAQITNAVNDYVQVPMETFTLAPGFVPLAGRWYWAGWAASGNPATFKFQIVDGGGGWTTMGDTTDAGFDSSALVWMGCMHNTDATRSTFYQLTQAKLDALAARFGFSEDVNPDAGVHAVLFELAVQPTKAATVLGEAGSVTVDADRDPDSGGSGIRQITATTPAGQGTTLNWTVGGVPGSQVVAPSSSFTQPFDALDATTVSFVEVVSDNELAARE